MKTNAARLLDAAGIPYSLHSYDVDESDLSAATVAAQVGLAVEQVFKTLCVRGDRTGPAFAVIPGNDRLDLKAMARLSGNRKVAPVNVKELAPLTGYVRGAVTVLGARRPFPVFVDELIELHELISVSGGRRGLQIFLRPADYCQITAAIVGPLTV